MGRRGLLHRRLNSGTTSRGQGRGPVGFKLRLPSYSDAARALGLTSARLTQLQHLTLLPPRVQENILLGQREYGRGGGARNGRIEDPVGVPLSEQMERPR